MQQVQQLSSRLASIDASATQSLLPALPLPAAQLSESFYLERERERAERQAERQAERERERADRAEREQERADRADRADRTEARLFVAFSVSACACAVSAAIVGAALLLKRAA
jgi:hypothetical protein